MAEAEHPHSGVVHDVEQADPGQNALLQRSVPATRYVFLLAIVSCYVAAVVLLVMGFVETFRVVFELLRFDGHSDLNTVRVHFIEIIDVFLLATILYVIASGFYQLFGPRNSNLPGWMRVSSVEDLEHKLIGVLITVLGVFGLARVVSWDGQSDLLPFGAAVALLIAALAFFATRTRH